jgi:hypothetical protein
MDQSIARAPEDEAEMDMAPKSDSTAPPKTKTAVIEFGHWP